MGEEPKKQNIAKEIFDDVVANLHKSAKEQTINYIYGTIMSSIDMFHGTLKDGITKGFYKGENPRNRGNYYPATTRSNDGYYARDYNAVSRQNALVGGEAATDVRAIFRPTQLAAEDKLNWIIEKIDNSSDNCCTVGALYESEEPKLPTTMMSWKYGWSEKDTASFTTKMVTSGSHSGEWILVLPKPHRVL